MAPTHHGLGCCGSPPAAPLADARPRHGAAVSEYYGIDAQYNPIRDRAEQSVMTAPPSRVSYDIPGQQQRFAPFRAFREDRAANEIAENIQTRPAAFFVAGTRNPNGEHCRRANADCSLASRVRGRIA